MGDARNRPTDNNRITGNSTINKWFEESYSKETCKTPKNITEILTDLYNINKVYKKFQDSGNNDDVKELIKTNWENTKFKIYNIPEPVAPTLASHIDRRSVYNINC